MAPNDNANSHAVWPQVILVLLLAAGALSLSPLISERPRPEKLSVPADRQDVEARLWQDPFEAVYRDQRAARPGSDVDAVLRELLKTPPLEWARVLSRAGGAASAPPAVGTAGRRPPSDETASPQTAKPCPAAPRGLASLLRSPWSTTGADCAPSGKAARQQPDSHQATSSDPRTVLYALVPGGGWVGASETRRRQRYALLAAINAQGYVPDDPEHIAYVKDELDGMQLIFPYEWFSHSQDGRKVLLLWVDEEKLRRPRAASQASSGPPSGPIGRLAKLICKVNEPVTPTVAGAAEAKPRQTQTPAACLAQAGEPGPGQGTPGQGIPRQVILGPYSSNFLVAVAKEICRRDDNQGMAADLAVVNTLPWYSALASIGDTELQTCAEHGSRVPRTLPFGDKLRPLGNKLRQLTRLTVTDDKLLDALRDEMAVRGVETESCKNRDEAVVLIGQWDTAYSRHLEEHLRNRLKDKDAVEVVRLSYLRGLDGRHPDAAPASPPEDKAKTAEEAVERPEGEAQLDYLRRMADGLHARLQGRTVRAVAVLGNDYHDKLLILEALRPHFRQAVFYTTDLDAAMLHARDNRHTRNLVVASAFGLSLHPVLQQVPPFRDTYQSASYWAALQALRGGAPQQDLQARLFEIGRYHAVPLHTGEPAPAGPCKTPYDCADPHPPATPMSSGQALLVALAFAALPLLLGLGLAATGFLRREQLGHWLLLAPAGVFLLGAWLSLAITRPPAEPLSFVEGVSIWPSELLRILALVLSLALIRLGCQRLTQTAEQVEKRYDIPDKPEARAVPADEQRRNAIERIWHLYRQPRNDAGMPRYLCAPWWLRYLVFAACVLALPYLVAGPLGLETPLTPARGAFAQWSDRLILWPTVLAYLGLLFFTLDRAGRAIWLAHQLTCHTEWPATAVNRLRLPGERHTDSNPDSNAGQIYADWLNAQLIATATVPVQQIVFYPFATLALLIFARSSVFDAWSIPPTLSITFALSALPVIVAALRLRLIAERVRRESVDRLNKHILDAQGQDKLLAQFERLLGQVQHLNIGAFAPFSQQPLFRAALTLLGSVSGITLLEYLSQTGF